MKQIPGCCPACGSTERVSEKTRKVRDLKHNGTIQGQRYNLVLFRKELCVCGQYLSVRYFKNVNSESE